MNSMLDCPDDIYISKSRGTVPKSYFNRVTSATAYIFGLEFNGF